MAGKGGGGWGALAGAVVGGTLGAFVGGPGGIMMGASLGASIGGMVGTAIDPPDSKLPNVQGAMEATVNTFHRNLPVPIVYGVCKVGGNAIWMGNVTTQVEETGGGKGKPVVRKIFYLADWAIALSEGTIQGVGRIWINEQEPTYTQLMGKETAWRAPASQTLINITDGGEVALTLGEDALSLTIKGYAGGPSQVADSLVAAAIPSHPPTFRYTGYLRVSGRIGQAPQIPNISSEIAGILTVLDPGLLSIPIVFGDWWDYHQWTLHQNGTFTFPGGDDGFYWWTDVSAVPAWNHATHVQMDVTKDFSMRFILNARANASLSRVQSAGVALHRRSDNLNIMYVFISLEGQQSGAVYSAHFAITASIQGLLNPSGPVAFTLWEVFGEPAIANQGIEGHVWVTVDKVGDHLTVRCATLTVPWFVLLEGDWAPADQTAWSPATVAFRANAQDSFVLGWLPTTWIDSFYMKYFSTVPVNYVQSANPALCVYDFLTNTRYGRGIPTSRLDVDSFADAAAFCDEDLAFPSNEEFIPTEDPEFPPPQIFDGAAERRFQLDLPLTEKKSDKDHLEDMLSTFRGFLVRQAGMISLRIEKATELDGAQEFSDAPTHIRQGIIQHTFEFSEISSRDRPNRVKVEYVRGDDNYRRDFVVANDEYDQEVRGEIIEKTYVLIGIKRQSQANRMVQFFQDQATHVRYLTSFRIGMAGMKSAVGDVCKVTHGVPGWNQKPMRILKVTEEPEDQLSLHCIEYVPFIYHDQAVPAIIDGTNIIAGDAFTAPHNAIRLRAFESRTDVLPRIYVTWSLDPSYSFYFETFVYRRRASEGLFVGQGQHVVDATTGYVSHLRLGFAQAIAFDSDSDAGTIRILNATGLSARVFDADNNQIDDAAAVGDEIELDVSGEANPFNGSIQLYGNTTLTAPMYRGRYPAEGSTSLPHQSSLTYLEEEIAYGPNPTTLYLTDILGALPDTGVLQIDMAAAAFTDFAEGLDADKVTGVSWPDEPTPITPDNRIADLTVSQKESGTHVDRTAGCLDPTTTITLFPALNDELYIGSATKRVTELWILLSRVASDDIEAEFSYSDDALGGYATQERLVDGTAGFTASGLLSIEPPQDWAMSAKDAAGNTIGDGIARYYLRIKRTAVTVTTPPQERRFFCCADQLLTLQEENNRVDYYYTPDDLQTLLTFEALTQNVVGMTADTARVPLTDWTVQQYQSLPPSPGNLQIDSQGTYQGFMGGDFVLNWLARSREIGAGYIEAGDDPEGAGGGAMEFDNYVVRIYDTAGELLVNDEVADDEGTGTYTYLEADRIADGLGFELVAHVYQADGNALSPPAVITTIAAELGDMPSIEDLVDFGIQYVPSMEDIDDLFALPGI